MNSIEGIMHSFTEIDNVYSDFIVETNYARKNSCISWPDYTPGNYKFIYAREYEHLLKNRQYSYLLKDKSLVQCFYRYSENALIEAKLAYYPFPVPLKDIRDDFEFYFTETDDNNIQQYYYDLYICMSEEFGHKIDSHIDNAKKHFELKYGYSLDDDIIRSLFFDKIYENSNYSHFRIDYDSQVTTHHKCEIQFGGIKSLRLPMDRVIDPLLFWDLIIRFFFKNEYDALNNERYQSSFNRARNNHIIIEGFSERNIFKTLS